MAMRIHVDFDLCQGHGACKNEAPAVFDVDEREHRVIVLAEEPPETERDAVKRAVKYCPTFALKLEG
jgi:ferredoxin